MEVQKDVLSRALSTASKAISPNPVIPLLGNILLESHNGTSRIAATNLELGIGTTFPSAGEEWRVCLPAKTIVGLIEAIPHADIELQLDSENQSVLVMTESSTSNIHSAPADEFPSIPQVTNPSLCLEVKQLKEMIARVAFAASTDPNHTTLTGVQFSVKGKKLILFAVDGIHFSYEETTQFTKRSVEHLPCVIKGTTLETISRILPEEGEVEIEIQENKALFHCDTVDVVTQLLAGEFPDYVKLREAIGEPTTTLIIPTIELLRASRQLRVFASEIGTSKLEANGMLLRYSALAQEKGDSDITFPAIKKGADIVVGLNVHLLYEFLEICKTETLTMEMAGPRSPLLFRMTGVDTFYHVIMPIGL